MENFNNHLLRNSLQAEPDKYMVSIVSQLNLLALTQDRLINDPIHPNFKVLANSVPKVLIIKPTADK